MGGAAEPVEAEAGGAEPLALEVDGVAIGAALAVWIAKTLLPVGWMLAVAELWLDACCRRRSAKVCTTCWF